MTTITAAEALPIKKTGLLNRWDSPWLNSKFVIGGAIIVFIILMRVLGSLVWDISMATAASAPLNIAPLWITESPGPAILPGDIAHPLGTEGTGRDMLALLIVATPRSFLVGVIAAGVGMIVGVILGFTAGFVGGWMDNVIRTIADAFITIPALAVLIVISAYVRQIEITNMGLLLALFAWPGPTRLIRAQVLSMRERGYVQMARLSGASTPAIMFKEMMPNLLPYLAASLTGNVSANILAATGLEVLGLGPTRIPTLGTTIFFAIRGSAILRGMWWWWGFPLLMLILIFSALFLMTIGLDEIANPRLRGVQAE